jgi:hypothetical protein
MRILRDHWTAQYAWDRLAFEAWNRTHPGAPWLVPAAVRMLARWLRPECTGIEWGSGRSTVWLGRRMRRLTSVEHDPKWFDQTRARLHRLGMGHVSLVLEPEMNRSYVEAATRGLEGPVDLVLVDGRQRDACELAGVKALGGDGWLVLDNAERYVPHESRPPEAIGPGAQPASPFWAAFLEMVRDWPLTWTSSGVSDTAIWVKPR